MSKSLLNDLDPAVFVKGQSAKCVKLHIFTESDYKDNVQGKKGHTFPNNINLANGLVAQQVQTQVSKQVRPVYEIGSNNYYLIDGRLSGNGTIQHLFGPSNTTLDKIKAFSNVCNPAVVAIDSSDGCTTTTPESTNSGSRMLYKGGTLTGLSSSLNSSDFTVMNALTFIFMDVQYATFQGSAAT